MQAQDFDLRPLMGEALYYDMLNRSEEDPYVRLIKGDVYNYSGVEIDCKGLKPVIVYYAAARLVANMSNSISPTIFSQKRNEFSDPVSPSEINRTVTMYQSLALGYWQQSLDYIERHRQTYTLFGRSCGDMGTPVKKSGAKIYGLGLNNKTNFSFKDGSTRSKRQ